MTTKIPVLLDRGITKIDQACALAALLEGLGVKVEDIEFYFLDLDKPENIPADVIDLDARLHYKRGHGKDSATQVVVERYGLTGLDSLLVDLAGNNASGFMRQGEGAFTRLGQKLNDLKAATTPLREHRLECIEHFAKVGATMMCASPPWNYEGVEEKFLARFPEFEKGFSKKPWHLSGYAWQCFLANPDDLDLLEDEVAWWAAKFDAAEKSQKLALKRAESMDLKAAQIGGLKVAVITARADEVAKAIFATYGELDVLVVQRPSAVAIMPNFQANLGGRMQQLYKELDRREPGSWHIEERGTSALIFNGSARRNAAPSKIGREKAQLYALMAEVWA